MPKKEEIPQTNQVVFEMCMADSTFKLEHTPTGFVMSEFMNDGTEVFQESVSNGQRLATILNRIRQN